ncbi:MAG: hypothetical protein R2940_18195 [Syntrophotaleaceae bacterium]
MKHNRAVLVLALAGVFAAAGLAVGFVLPSFPLSGKAGAGGKGLDKGVQRDRREWKVYDALQGYHPAPRPDGSRARLYPAPSVGGKTAGENHRSRRMVSGLEEREGRGQELALNVPSTWPENVRHGDWPDLNPVIIWPDTGGRGSDTDGEGGQFPPIIIIPNPGGNDGSGDDIGQNPGPGGDDQPKPPGYGWADAGWGEENPNTANPTPVPGAVWLLGSGLAVCWRLRLRKKADKSVRSEE